MTAEKEGRAPSGGSRVVTGSEDASVMAAALEQGAGADRARLAPKSCAQVCVHSGVEPPVRAAAPADRRGADGGGGEGVGAVAESGARNDGRRGGDGL